MMTIRFLSFKRTTADMQVENTRSTPREITRTNSMGITDPKSVAQTFKKKFKASGFNSECL